jgi:hypothetical protein
MLLLDGINMNKLAHYFIYDKTGRIIWHIIYIGVPILILLYWKGVL